MHSRVVLLPLMSLLLASIAAHPNYWEGIDAQNRAAAGNDGPTSTCLHPTMGMGSHAGLAADPTISFSLAQGDLAAITYCPGTTMTATVRFMSLRQAFLTTSLGVFSANTAMCGDRSQVYAGQRVDNIGNTITIPCGTTVCSAVAVLLLSAVCAHPINWHTIEFAERLLTGNIGPASVCTHPDKAYGLHGLGKAPLPDSSITFALTKDGQTVTTYCPGTSVDVKVGFEEGRQAYLTSSLGKFKSGLITCGGRSQIYGYANMRLENLTNTVEIPCGTTGDLMLKVTSAVGVIGRYLQSSATFPQAEGCTVCK